MAHDSKQTATDRMRARVLTLGQEDAVELARQSLTGRGITPGSDWHVSNAGSHWLVQNLPVVRMLVSKDTGQVRAQDSAGI